MLVGGVAVLAGCAEPLNDEQYEKVEAMVEECEVYLPAIQHLARAANPLVDAEGNPVEDNEILAQDLADTVKDVRDIFEHGGIKTWHEVGGDYGRHPWDVTPHTFEGQFIYLNSTIEEYWSCGLIVHEGAHRFQSHTAVMDAEMRTDRGADDGGRGYAQVVLREQDYPSTAELLTGAIGASVHGTTDVWEQTVEETRIKYEKEKLTKDECQIQLADAYQAMMIKTRETWATERADAYYTEVHVLEVFGIPQSALVVALQAEGVYELTQERMTERYNEALREIEKIAEKKEGQESNKFTRSTRR